MKERPILFSAPMVRSLLAGTKTQTRRVVKGLTEKMWIEETASGGFAVCYDGQPSCGTGVWEVAEYAHPIACPYGQPGDRLWVRETFSGPWCMEAQDGFAAAPPSKWGRESRIWYWADGEPSYGDWTRPRPSIHMPRWASRITLEVTEVRVERLQSISEADAVAEGIERPEEMSREAIEALDVWSTGAERACFNALNQPVHCYRRLWDEINGAGSWAANPWVWAVSFKVVKGGGL